jgi:hypothetical protein
MHSPEGQYDHLPHHALEAQGYSLTGSFSHLDLVGFLQPYMKGKSKTMMGFWIINALLLGALIACCWLAPADIDILGALGLGFAFSFVLIPLHEFMHALAFRSLGATKIFYGANWKKLYFFAGADWFVLGARGFYRVAFAPCVSIGLVLLTSSLFAGSFLQISLLATTLLHTGMSAGDFALVAWFEKHNHKQPLTFDDCKARRSYFYTII